ncbi:hypothetical protein LCGC14_1608550 [marine sediment metagenome]|uniref:Uncharacterized protein n=1 Tax=marine sediment metagenome TaxID=412755 RepID=A0A0F9L9A5_9ZZZZ
MTTIKEDVWRAKAMEANRNDPSSAFVGVACPKCWLPISLDSTTDPTVCRCGNATTVEEILAAHGLPGLVDWLVPGPGLPRRQK